MGIMNGTCNFILTKMTDEGKAFDVVLKEAQELGFAEADPTFDIEGIDTAHKMAIILSLAYGKKVNLKRYLSGRNYQNQPRGYRFCQRTGIPDQIAGNRQTQRRCCGGKNSSDDDSFRSSSGQC